MGNSIRLGKLFGIQIEIDLSWLLIFGLVTWSLAQHYFTGVQNWSAALRWTLAIVASVLFFASVLAHELAHSLVSQREGMPVESITLYLFGGASKITAEPRRARDEFWMALVGPLTSLALAVAFGVVWMATQFSSTAGTVILALGAITGWLAGVNLMLGLFNLVPGFPLDGGRLLRSVVWAVTKNLRRATQVAVGAGMLIAWGMIALGVWFVLEGDWADGLWIAFIGWFLSSAGQQEGRVTIVHDLLRGHTAREVQLTECPRVLKQLSLDVFLGNVAVPSGHDCFAVMERDQFLGLAMIDRLRHVPRAAWETTRLAQVMIPAEKLVTAQLDEDLAAVMEKLEQSDVKQLPVFDGDCFVGVITPTSLLAFLRSHAQRVKAG